MEHSSPQENTSQLGSQEIPLPFSKPCQKMLTTGLYAETNGYMPTLPHKNYFTEI